MTRADIDSICYSTDYGKLFCLLACKAVYAETLPNGLIVLRVHLDGGIVLAATPLHSFVTIRDGQTQSVRADELQPGDLFWIDVAQFLGDGSFGRRSMLT